MTSTASLPQAGGAGLPATASTASPGGAPGATAGEHGLPLELGLLASIEPALAGVRQALGHRALSEYAFANLYLFRQAHDYRYLPGEWPCVAGRTYDGARHLLPLFDPREAPADVLAALLRGHDCFFPIPEEGLVAFDAARFEWTALPDDSDYLYPAANFRDYRGEKLRKKRNLMKQLLAAHRVETHRLDASRILDAMKVLGCWMDDKGKLTGDADELPCLDALHLVGHFGLDAEIHYADGRPAGFVIAQPMAPGVAVMRFAKGTDAFKGIYQYMFHRFCAAREGSLEWLNFEQDLGLANFRRTKQSYQPLALLPKYRVRLRPAT
ncbi:MAG TPA: phosphatidylglycerol lysyltransferase domain-containing protein [Quisquiliibacterium sp.]|nr:phosphatidylglycerol lysyltransferase domain-containing protein [Quisquiliibacterium sp.]